MPEPVDTAFWDPDAPDVDPLRPAPGHDRFFFCIFLVVFCSLFFVNSQLRRVRQFRR